MDSFYVNFGLSNAQLLRIQEKIIGNPIRQLHVALPGIKGREGTAKQPVTFRFTTHDDHAGELSLFVKKCVWKGRSEAVHYHHLTTAGVPMPHLYAAPNNDAGEEILFLEPLTAIGFNKHSEIEWRQMLSLLARFNACHVTPDYVPHLHPFEQVGQIDGGLWITGLPSSPSDEEIESGLRTCGISTEQLPTLKTSAQSLFAQVQAQPQGLLHQDFLPDNFGWRGERAEMVVFDVPKNAVGPRFADVAPYLATPDWSPSASFLDAASHNSAPHRDALTAHYLNEYARFGGAHVPLETFRAETTALFWAHKVTVLPLLIEQQQHARVQEVLDFLERTARHD